MLDILRTKLLERKLTFLRINFWICFGSISWPLFLFSFSNLRTKRRYEFWKSESTFMQSSSESLDSSSWLCPLLWRENIYSWMDFSLAFDLPELCTEASINLWPWITVILFYHVSNRLTYLNDFCPTSWTPWACCHWWESGCGHLLYFPLHCALASTFDLLERPIDLF